MLHTVILYVYVISHENFNSVAEFYRRKILRFDISIYEYCVLSTRTKFFAYNNIRLCPKGKC